MRIAGLASLLAATAIAAPTEMIEARQAVGNTANELESGACRPLILIFARGSTQPGNLVSEIGLLHFVDKADLRVGRQPGTSNL